MTSPDTAVPLDDLRLVAHDVRWELLGYLAQSDRRVNELVALSGKPQNLVSYHLRQLRSRALVQERRSSQDGRDVYYSLDLPRLKALFQTSASALHPALGAAAARHGVGESAPLRVLFLCTHNSARSQLAEGFLRAQGGDRFVVHSAGSQPAAVHPLAVWAAAALGVDISGQTSAHMDHFSTETFDIVVTVCDQVREVCPTFPNSPREIHWSIADPAAVTGSTAVREAAFLATAQSLWERVFFLRQLVSSDYRQQMEAS